MTPEDMAMRAISEATSLSGNAVAYTDMTRQVSDDQFREILMRTQDLKYLPIHLLSIDFARPGSLIAGVRRALRTMGMTNGKTPLVVVDYLQLMDAEGRSKIEKITEISLQTKRLAVKEGAAVLALSQLSRAVESRENKRPIMSDLRESGQIEQDADTIIFCYRDEYYAEREKPEDHRLDEIEAWQERMRKSHNRLELIVAKQRRGPIGTAGLKCALKYNRIWD
jgi:replicative DNA helicase